jgi:hypothetical protein
MRQGTEAASSNRFQTVVQITNLGAAIMKQTSVKPDEYFGIIHW